MESDELFEYMKYLLEAEKNLSLAHTVYVGSGLATILREVQEESRRTRRLIKA